MSTALEINDIWVKGPQPSVDLLAFAQSVDR